MAETCRAACDLYHYFNDKRWEQHESHVAVHSRISGPVRLTKPDLVWRMAAQLEGVDKRARDISNTFLGEAKDVRWRALEKMVKAGVKEWCKVPGIGKKMAVRIRKELGHHE